MCRTASDGWYFQVNDQCAVLVMVLIAGALCTEIEQESWASVLVNLVHFSCFICKIEHDFLVYHWAELVAKFFVLVFFSLRWGCREHFVSGCWHSSARDRGRYSRECWLSTLGVLHPGVPVMWYGHIRDLFPTAEGCMGSRLPNVSLFHWACLCAGVRQ